MPEQPIPWTMEHGDANTVTVRWDTGETGRGWEGWVLVSGDRHHDNAHSNHNLERKHLKQAKERGAAIVDVGDLFCAMQGKWDKRQSRDALRPEFQSGPYLQTLVREAERFYGPYAKNWVYMGTGNHETAMLGRHEFDLTDELCERLRDNHGGDVRPNGYGGFVRFMFSRGKEKRTLVMRCYHGTGGGGPVTKDTIRLNRMMVEARADIYVWGHTHDKWAMNAVQAGLTRCGRVEQRRILAIKPGTYKDEWGLGDKGWAIEKGHPPKPLGAYWIRFTWDQLKGPIAEAVEAI
jgi:hypothetical protein